MEDKLPNSYFNGFDPKLHVEIDLEKVKWIVLSPLRLRVPGRIDPIKDLKGYKNAKGQNKGTKRRREGGAEKLQVHQSWNERNFRSKVVIFNSPPERGLM